MLANCALMSPFVFLQNLCQQKWPFLISVVLHFLFPMSLTEKIKDKIKDIVKNACFQGDQFETPQVQLGTHHQGVWKPSRSAEHLNVFTSNSLLFSSMGIVQPTSCTIEGQALRKTKEPLFSVISTLGMNV